MKFIKLLSAICLLSTTSHPCKAMHHYVEGMEYKEGDDDTSRGVLGEDLHAMQPA